MMMARSPAHSLHKTHMLLEWLRILRRDLDEKAFVKTGPPTGCTL